MLRQLTGRGLLPAMLLKEQTASGFGKTDYRQRRRVEKDKAKALGLLGMMGRDDADKNGEHEETRWFGWNNK